jgi:hypothetical protein
LGFLPTEVGRPVLEVAAAAAAAATATSGTRRDGLGAERA